MFLGFEDVSAKYFSSVISHVHWVYCAYILLNSSPPGFPIGVKSMAEKQLMVNKIIENKGLAAVWTNSLHKLKVHNDWKLLSRRLSMAVAAANALCYAGCRGFRWISFNI